MSAGVSLMRALASHADLADDPANRGCDTEREGDLADGMPGWRACSWQPGPALIAAESSTRVVASFEKKKPSPSRHCDDRCETPGTFRDPGRSNRVRRGRRTAPSAQRPRSRR